MFYPSYCYPPPSTKQVESLLTRTIRRNFPEDAILQFAAFSLEEFFYAEDGTNDFIRNANFLPNGL
jgi:hypothetical protein